MPGPDALGGPAQSEPIYLAGCRLTVYPDKKTPPSLQCYYDRERLGNKELTQGLKCERKIETRIEEGKRTLDINIICTPKAEQVLRDVRLWKVGKPS